MPEQPKLGNLCAQMRETLLAQMTALDAVVRDTEDTLLHATASEARDDLKREVAKIDANLKAMAGSSRFAA